VEEDLDRCSRGDLKALIRTLVQQVEQQEQRIKEQERRIAELEARLNEPPKNRGNSSVPPSKAFKANKNQGDGKDGKTERTGPRAGSLGRKGTNPPLAENPHKIVRVMAKAAASAMGLGTRRIKPSITPITKWIYLRSSQL
jgi:transposase